MKKIIIPALIMVMGTGGTFASKILKDSRKAVVQGFRIKANGDCDVSVKDCETFNTGTICTSVEGGNTYQLKQLQGSMCVTDLYEIEP